MASEAGPAEGAAAADLAPQPLKVVVLFKATGDAPILKQSKFKITASDRFSKVVLFLRTQLQRETVFVYLRSAFTPSLDDRVLDLFETFGEDNKLVVYYALTPAWG